jgi:hypothetical protein
MSGSSQLGNASNAKTNRVLFSLKSAKKLFYLKYDSDSETIYVSTSNHVYACSLQQARGQRDECLIIADDLQSARGLFLDSVNRYLYVIDHKKQLIKRINLAKKDLKEETTTVTTVLSADTMSDIGSIFYMTIFDKSGTSKLIWSEFFGKIKITNLNDQFNFELIFSTNEFTYSICLMDNSSLSDTTNSKSEIKAWAAIVSLKEISIKPSNQILIAIYVVICLICISFIKKKINLMSRRKQSIDELKETQNICEKQVKINSIKSRGKNLQRRAI